MILKNIDTNDIANRYIAMWNEPSAATRREIILGLWSPEGACLSKSFQPRGYEALEERVATAHERWIVQGGYRFFPLEGATGHHNVVRFRWKMAPTFEAPAESTGQEFLVLDDACRIVAAYQFVDS